MSVIWMDSLDLFADEADVIKAGYMKETASQTFSTSQGRFGGGCLKNTVATNGWYIPTYVAISGTIIYAFAYYLENRAGGGATDTILTGRDRNGNQLFRLEQNASGDLKAYNQPNTQVGSTASGVLNDTAWHWIEVKVVLGNGAANGSIEVKVGGTTVIGPVSSIDVNNGNDLSYTSFFGSAGDVRFDDFVIMDGNGTDMNDFIGDSKFDVFLANSDGTLSQWTASAGADYQCVDDTPNAANDDTDYISSNTSGQKSDFGMSNFADIPPAVHCVQMRSRARKTDAGTRTYRLNILSGGSTANGTTLGLTTNYCWRRNGVVNLNPNGSVDWTRASANAAQVQAETIS